MTNTFDLQLKLLMIGDSEVGKTCLIWRYACDTFSSRTINTIGIDFKTKYVVLDETKVKIQIWDTAGQERFRTITTSYFRGAQGVFLVYDVTDRNSFASVHNWVKQIKLHADVDINRILIGNKCDLEDERRVRYDEGLALAQEYGMNFFETSAKEDRNVNDAFLSLASDVKHRLLRYDNLEMGNMLGVRLSNDAYGAVPTSNSAASATISLDASAHSESPISYSTRPSCNC